MQALALWQKALLFVLGFFFSLAVSLFIISGILNQTVLNRGFVSEVVGSRGFYDVFGSTLAGAIRGEPREGQVQASADELQTIVNNYIEYEQFKQETTGFVDGFFDWLDGTTQQVEFEVKLFNSEEEINNALVDLFSVKLDALPVCESVEAARQAQEDFFEANCRPPDLNRQQIAQELDTSKLETEDEAFQKFLETGTLSSQDLDFQNDIDQNLRNGYDLVKLLPLILLGAMAAFSLLALLITRKLQPWLQFLGKNFIRSALGITVILLLVFSVFKLPSRLVESANSASSEIELPLDSLLEMTSLVESQLTTSTLVYGVPLVALGILLYVLSHRMYRHRPNSFKHAVEKETHRHDFSSSQSSETKH